jgi:hypothetical protein
MFSRLVNNTSIANKSQIIKANTISKNEWKLNNHQKSIENVRRSFLFFIIFCINFLISFAQDVITLKNGDDIQALVQEIGEVDIKYKKYDNPNGHSYTMKKTEIFMIKYANGSKDVFANIVHLPTDQQNVKRTEIVLDEELLEISRNNPMALLKKGNKVFVEANEASKGCSKEYFIPYMQEWGYWEIVNNYDEAHFIIVFNVEGKAMGDRASSVVFKTRENIDFKKSKSYRGSINAFSGYNAYRATSRNIVNDYFKKEFK